MSLEIVELSREVERVRSEFHAADRRNPYSEERKSLCAALHEGEVRLDLLRAIERGERPRTHEKEVK